MLARFGLERMIKMQKEQTIWVRSKSPPVVEIDTSVSAAYVRFKRQSTRVARTKQLEVAGPHIVTVDYDRVGEVIGIELLGVTEFGIVKLLEMAQASAPNVDLERARYVGAGRLAPALAAVG